MTHPHLEGLIKEWREDAHREAVQGRNKEWADWVRERHMGTASALWRCANELEAALAALPGGGVDEVASLGHVSGYLSKAIEVAFDAGTPEWLRQPGMRVYLTGEPLLRTIGRSGEGHNADWCAGWNACLVATSRGDIRLSPTPNPHEADRNG